MSTSRRSDEEIDHQLDRHLDQLIGAILQVGVLVAGLVVLAGGAIYLVQYGFTLANYGEFSPERAAVHGLLPIISAALNFDGRAIIQLGILLLIATPVLRVIFSVLAFAVQRDRLYIPITLVVLGILFYGLFG